MIVDCEFACPNFGPTIPNVARKLMWPVSQPVAKPIFQAVHTLNGATMQGLPNSDSDSIEPIRIYSEQKPMGG